MTERFEPSSQAWVEHGFAFLTFNYRGSTTFGREFQEKIWGKLGFWETEDLAAARHWLVTENKKIGAKAQRKTLFIVRFPLRLGAYALSG